jgi:hypothetical protein
LATNVYIDGFNFYYGVVKNTPYKWLDFRRLSEGLLRGHQIGSVKYFTARVTDRPNDPYQSQRQDTFIRALQTRGVEPYFGFFQTRPKTVWVPARGGKPGRSIKAEVTEEKGTDVTLGAHLLWDAFHAEMNCALVLSNDADLQVPVKMAINFHVPVIIVNPHRHLGQRDCLFGSESRKLNKRLIVSSQLPREVTDAGGRIIVRPSHWDP